VVDGLAQGAAHARHTRHLEARTGSRQAGVNGCVHAGISWPEQYLMNRHDPVFLMNVSPKSFNLYA
jgi:hypothetical protein